MRHYCDASVLTKAFVGEEGSDAVSELLSQPGDLSTSHFGLVEVASALCRAAREGRLPEDDVSVVAEALRRGELAPLKVLPVSRKLSRPPSRWYADILYVPVMPCISPRRYLLRPISSSAPTNAFCSPLSEKA